MGCHHIWGAPIAARQACPLQEPRTPPAWAGTLAQRRLETQLLHGAYPTYRLVMNQLNILMLKWGIPQTMVFNTKMIY